MLTQERARFLFRYDAETGRLFWRNKSAPRSNRIKVGGEVGNIFNDGKYRQCSVDGKKYLVHRVIWLLHSGMFPLVIDHIDGDGLNNRLGNLREVTLQGNAGNSSLRADNTSGVLGVYWHKGAKKWLAQAQVAGEYVYLGLYATIESAQEARLRASEKFGFHKNHGRKPR